jgi:hypothetical protein
MNIDIQRYWGDKEIYFVGELCAKIIESMQKDSTVTLFCKEQRSGRESGLYYLLDQLSAYHDWNKSKIIIKTVNWIESHDQYTIEFMRQETMPLLLTEAGIIKTGVEHRPWNHEKTYGMFLGRANVTRIYGIHKHKQFEFANQGLVSWHHDLKQQVDTPVLTEYLMATNQTYEEMVSIEPFSDIGPVLTPPITDAKAGGVDWNSVYEKIGIELVFETSESSSAISMSEKLLRPMIYKRPFILISGQHAIRNIKEIIVPRFLQRVDPNIDICFFENVFSNAYDNDHGIWRVEHVFDILRELILTDKIQTIIEDCQEGIETNYNFAQTMLHNNPYIHTDNPLIFDFESWKKPAF